MNAYSGLKTADRYYVKPVYLGEPPQIFPDGFKLSLKRTLEVTWLR